MYNNSLMMRIKHCYLFPVAFISRFILTLVIFWITFSEVVTDSEYKPHKKKFHTSLGGNNFTFDEFTMLLFDRCVGKCVSSSLITPN